uniref:Uncharacterized protein n=1 Tax=Eutreptiella gymnastica TaxID=73025 RepID=A0A7S4CXB7_9EUGL
MATHSCRQQQGDVQQGSAAANGFANGQQQCIVHGGSNREQCLWAAPRGYTRGQLHRIVHMGSSVELCTCAAAGILLPQNKPNAVVFLQRHANLVNQPFK